MSGFSTDTGLKVINYILSSGYCTVTFVGGDSNLTTLSLQVYLHDQEELPFIRDLGIAVPPGMHSLLNIHNTQVIFMNYNMLLYLELHHFVYRRICKLKLDFLFTWSHIS